jgi:PilZ domain-containing protein
MVHLLDLSEGGCRLRTGHEFRLPKPGASLGVLEFHVPPGPRGDLFKIDVRLKNLVEKEAFWLVGAQFMGLEADVLERLRSALKKVSSER